MLKRKLSAAYEKPTYTAAKAAWQRIRADLAEVNASAAASLDEGRGGDVDPAPAGAVRESGPVVQDDELQHARERVDRAADGEQVE